MNRRKFLSIFGATPLVPLLYWPGSQALAQAQAGLPITAPLPPVGGHRGPGALFATWRRAHLEGEVRWGHDAMSVHLVNPAQYGPDLERDETLAVLPPGARIASGPLRYMEIISTGNGHAACNADDVIIPLPRMTEGPLDVLVLLARDRDQRLAGYIGHFTVLPKKQTVEIHWAEAPFYIYQL